jgi:hypothetical protein
VPSILNANVLLSAVKFQKGFNFTPFFFCIVAKASLTEKKNEFDLRFLGIQVRSNISVARVLSEGRERDSGSLTVLVFKFDLSIWTSLGLRLFYFDWVSKLMLPISFFFFSNSIES